ncbi:MAG TPA: hypothetical protein VK436_10535 [Methanocella sp.]|nr:hypothetical protein [Methanocella sp.]
MLKQLSRIAISVAGIAAATILASIALSGAYVIFVGSGYGSMPVTISNALFFLGGFLILIGVIIEFFRVKCQGIINRFLYNYGIGRMVIEGLSGWTLICSGGLMITLSLAVVFAAVK